MSDSKYLTYREYVGQPKAFDALGAGQFTLLTMLGLREHHTLLDFGCGALRSGRFFISYLQKGNYFGIDPNAWLIHEALEQEIGLSLVGLKAPKFRFNSDFHLDLFTQRFDYIQAHSVVTHASHAMIMRLFKQVHTVLQMTGIFVGTFKSGVQDYSGSEWIYPRLVTYQWGTIKAIAKESDLVAHRLRWPHPNQSYFILLHKGLNIRGFLRSIDRSYLLSLDDLVVCD